MKPKAVLDSPMPCFEEMIRAIGPLDPERSRELAELLLEQLIGTYPEREAEFRARMKELLAIEDRVREEAKR